MAPIRSITTKQMATIVTAVPRPTTENRSTECRSPVSSTTPVSETGSSRKMTFRTARDESGKEDADEIIEEGNEALQDLEDIPGWQQLKGQLDKMVCSPIDSCMGNSANAL